jgi:glycosyltransferase involved in cell wall biosynthesis
VPKANPVLLFASYHAYLDHSSGAALATRDLFEDLTAHGWDCRVVCGPVLDYQDARGVASVLQELGIAHHVERCAPPRGTRYALYHYTLQGVPVSQYQPAAYVPQRPPTQDEGIPFLDVVSRACALHRPHVLLTYGGLPVAPHLIGRAKRHGTKVLFCLHNFDYANADLLRQADALWVPSEFARQTYRTRVGVEAEAAPWPWDHGRVIAEDVKGDYITFVNPIPVKGVAWFARIASELFRQRPEIPLLVVEGRGGVDWLRRVPLDLSALTNLRGMHSTPQPREFYARSRLVLMPSLCEESFGRVAAEALSNGIPVLASRRGALPETLGGAGLLFDVPERYTCPAQMMDVPRPEEVADWVAAIERLWDDTGDYEAQRTAARERAKAWESGRLRPFVEDFFRRIAER